MNTAFPSLTTPDLWNLLCVPPNYSGTASLIHRFFGNQRFSLILQKGEQSPTDFKAPVEMRTGRHFRGLFPVDPKKIMGQVCTIASVERIEAIVGTIGELIRPTGWQQSVNRLKKRLKENKPGVIGLFQGRDCFGSSLNFLDHLI